MKKIILFFAAMAAFGCTEKENTGNGGVPSAGNPVQYAVMYSSGTNGYIMQVDDITSGVLDGTSSSNGRIQVTGSRDYVQVGDRYLYNINYASKSSNGTSTLSTSWKCSSDYTFEKRNDLDLSGDIKARCVWNNYIVASSSLSKGDPAKAYERIKIIDVEKDVVVNNDGYVNTHAGEYDPSIKEHVTFSDMAPYGNYLLVALKTKNSTEKGAYTSLERNMYLAVYSYDGNSSAELKRERLIVRESPDGRPAGQIGGNNRSRTETGIEPVDDGRIFLFCQGISTVEDGRTLPPSVVLRISGSNISNGMPVGVDEDYYCNISELSGGYRMWRSYYMGGTLFCLQMYSTAGDENISEDTKLKFALFDAETCSFSWVKGVPDTISDVSLPVLIEKDKSLVSFAVTTADSNPAIYSVGPDGVFSRGMEIKAESVEGIARLVYNK